MERLKSLRKARGLKQEDVATFLGITKSAYGNYELGQREPSLASLVKLADYFNVSVDYLLERTSNAMIYDSANLSATGNPRLDEMISVFRQLSPSMQENVLLTAKALLNYTT
ncbi:MAG: helix-turn-helix domain-containing protein [Clostridia bacterium]|nr:helix-turn-helix domain-containing protein [Clostridia bacterium]